MIDAVDVIRAKRDGAALDDEQIRWAVAAFVDGRMSPEQMSALAMAVVWRGMEDHEIATLTQAMIDSGTRLDLGGLGRPTVDKHSTGGVGDSVTLPLAPLVAACGAAVPQLSGRGLGHTGGTLDKLEAIPGWSAEVPQARMREILADVGAVVCAAGADLVPADRELYALRDVTGTVESIPLIAASIMSKKLAEGAAALILDVKVGRGAFMRRRADAETLARTMVRIGRAAGVDTRALLTDMDVPLGRAAGNALEVAAAVEVLAGGGPEDLVEVTLALAHEMLDAAGLDADPVAALRDGRAMDRWRRMIAAQGGDPDAPLPRAAVVHEVRAETAGVLTDLDALAVGRAAWKLGAGRRRRGDAVSAAAGVRWRHRVGEPVGPGAVLFELHADDDARIAAGLAELDGAAVVDPAGEPTAARSRLLDRFVD